MSCNGTMGDLRVTIRAAKSLKTVKAILIAAKNRYEDARYIGWPALEESLRRELADCEAIAREKGLAQ